MPRRIWCSGLLAVALVAPSSPAALATSTRGPLETRLTPMTVTGSATLSVDPLALPVTLDADMDGTIDTVEATLGSDPADPASTPESVAIPESCLDGIDNDLDGSTDESDPDCQPPAVSRETFPSAGIDAFESTIALEGYELETPLGVCPLNFKGSGPTVVRRGDPIDVGGGLRTLDTEIEAMQLAGIATLFPDSPCNTGPTPLPFPATLVEDPNRPSAGKVSDTNAGPPDFPAESFFDVNLLVHTPLGLLPVGPPGGPAGAPLRVTNGVNSIPPYHSPANPALNPDCYTVAGLPHKHCPKPPLDHFKCYSGAFPSFASRRVTLEDQFDRKRTSVGQPDRFCNAVGKNGLEIFDRGAHLKRYAIEDLKGQTRFAPLGVLVHNQFGFQELTVVRPVGLLVPSQKDELAPPLALDHFTCYSVKGPDVARTVSLVDQFDEQDGTVEQAIVSTPRTLCAPVAKTVRGVTTPIGDDRWHLVCYSIATGAFTPRSVLVTNQFGKEIVTVTEPVELCVPSLKSVKPPIEPPTLELVPPRIQPGQTIKITGEGFTPDGIVTKTFVRPDGTRFSFKTKADGDGAVTGDLKIPRNTRRGTWTVIVRDDATGQEVVGTFRVRRPSRGTLTRP